MHIHLKRGEKIYVNGAVLRFDRRTSVEFLNDVSFLLENHVMQAEDATTPFRQLYFVIQSMLIDPTSAETTLELFKHLMYRAENSTADHAMLARMAEVHRKVIDGRYFDALRLLRRECSEETATRSGV